MEAHRTWLVGLAVLLAAGAGGRAAGDQSIAVWIDGKRLDSDALLLNRVDRAVLPMRVLFEALGARVEWDPGQQAVYAWRPDGSGVRLALDEREAQTLRMSPNPGPGHWGRVTGSHPLEAPALLISGRVYVPLRFAAEALQADVRFVASESAVRIRTTPPAVARTELPPERVDPARPGADRPEPGEDPDPARGRGPADEPPLPDRERVRTRTDSLVLWLEVVGRPVSVDTPEVPIRLIMQNASDRPLTLSFNSGQRFDIEILRDDRLIWNWSQGRVFTQATYSVTLAPGESRGFTARWPVETNEGRPVRPGRYLVRGYLTTDFAGRRPLAQHRLVVGE